MKPLLKIFLFLTILICNYSILNAQSVVWRQIIGEQYDDFGSESIELRDKGYLMVGTKQVNFSGPLTFRTYLVRLDKFGSIVWQKVIDSLNTNSALSVIEDPDGNIYLPYYQESARLMKMNSSGTLLWNKDYSSYGIQSFWGISFVNNFKNFIIVGRNNIFQTQTASLNKLDTSGNMIWSKSYFDSIPSISTYDVYGNSLLVSENSYFISGAKGFTGFIIRTDTSGNVIWNKKYIQSEYISSIAVISENTFIAVGRGTNYRDYYMKFDNNGDTIWTKILLYDSSNYYGSSKIVKYYSGNFAVGTARGGNFTKIGITDSLGNIVSIFRNDYPEYYLLAQESLITTSDSGIVSTGFLKNFNLFENRYDVLIFKVDKNGNMVAIKNNNEIIADNFEINTFPNPFNLSFKLSFNLSRTSKVKVELYDLSGKKVREIENKSLISGNHQYLINTPELSSGIYFLRFDTGREVYSKKVLLVK